MTDSSKNILLTGAFGRLGEMTSELLKKQGHEVFYTDLPTPANKKTATKLGLESEALWGDITKPEFLTSVFPKLDAIIHLAAILPPVSELQPELTDKVNVQATNKLLELAETQHNKPVFIFPSSVTVFGYQQDKPAPRTVDDPIEGTDNYTRSKVACEKLLKESGVPWIIGRIGVSIDSRTTRTDLATLKQLLATRPDNRMEYVHPKDIALALANAVSCPAAVGKVLLLGGGANCQVRQKEFIKVVFGSAGITIPESLLGDNSYYYDWMDTKEAQQLLNFQKTSFADYEQEMQEKMRFIRLACKPLSPLIVLFLKALVAR